MTKDGKIVLFHDRSLKRFGKRAFSVETLTLNELKKFDAGRGETIPTLEALISLSDEKLTLILEIKYHPKTYKKLCEILVPQIANKKKWIEVSCFQDDVLAYIHHLDPEIRLHKLIEEKRVLSDESLLEKYDYTAYFDIEVSLRKEVMRKGLFSDKKVIFWTVENEDLSIEKNAGLYGIMVNNISKQRFE